MVLSKIDRWTKWLWLQAEVKFMGKVCSKEAKPRMTHQAVDSHPHLSCASGHGKRASPCTALLVGSADREETGPKDLGL